MNPVKNAVVNPQGIGAYCIEWGKIPQEFRFSSDNTPWNAFVSLMLHKRVKKADFKFKNPSDAIDCMNHLNVVVSCGAFDMDYKNALCSYLLSLWCHKIRYYVDEVEIICS